MVTLSHNSQVSIFQLINKLVIILTQGYYCLCLNKHLVGDWLSRGKRKLIKLQPICAPICFQIYMLDLLYNVHVFSCVGGQYSDKFICRGQDGTLQTSLTTHIIRLIKLNGPRDQTQLAGILPLNSKSFADHCIPWNSMNKISQ